MIFPWCGLPAFLDQKVHDVSGCLHLSSGSNFGPLWHLFATQLHTNAVRPLLFYFKVYKSTPYCNLLHQVLTLKTLCAHSKLFFKSAQLRGSFKYLFVRFFFIPVIKVNMGHTEKDRAFQSIKYCLSVFLLLLWVHCLEFCSLSTSSCQSDLDVLSNVWSLNRFFLECLCSGLRWKRVSPHHWGRPPLSSGGRGSGVHQQLHSRFISLPTSQVKKNLNRPITNSTTFPR